MSTIAHPCSAPRPPLVPPSLPSNGATQSLPRHHVNSNWKTPSVGPAPPVSPSLPQTAPPARAQQSNEAPGPRRPSIAPLAPDSTPRDTAGRRVTKQRRITRAVQPLACYFCRGRKIACGPPANQGSGDRTCEYVVTRTSVSLH
jgi:hypothetical protein